VKKDVRSTAHCQLCSYLPLMLEGTPGISKQNGIGVMISILRRERGACEGWSNSSAFLMTEMVAIYYYLLVLLYYY